MKLITIDHNQLVSYGPHPQRSWKLDDVTWIPLDILSRIIVELIGSSVQPSSASKESNTLYYNLVNPTSSCWLDIVLLNQRGSASAALSKKLETNPFSAWVDKLEESSRVASDVSENPGIKLVDFYRSVAGDGERSKPDISEAQKRSITLSEICKVNEEWMGI